MDLKLYDRIVAISGAASGIGLACARSFAEEGATVILLDRDQAALERAFVHFDPDRSAMIVCDVTDVDSVRSAIGAIESRWGALHHLVSCAGVSGPMGVDLATVTRIQWDQLFAVNVTGAFLLAQAAHPLLLAADSPSIVMMASDSAVVAAPGMVPYCASKGAVLQLARSLSVEWADDGIRVNAVCPSIVDTPMSRRDLGLEESGFVDATFPVQTAEEIARHVLYLSSPTSRSINAVALLSDFGYLARSNFPA